MSYQASGHRPVPVLQIHFDGDRPPDNEHLRCALHGLPGAGARMYDEIGDHLRLGPRTEGGMSVGNDWHDLSREQLVICHKALAHFGEEKQTLKSFEELGEVAQALAKAAAHSTPETRHDLSGEIADAFIMLVQMAHLHGIEGNVGEAVQMKLDRLSGLVSRAHPMMAMQGGATAQEV